MIKGQGWSLTIEQDVAQYGEGYIPDPGWSYSDPAGHVHRHLKKGESPTWHYVVVSTYWCEDCADEHENGEDCCRVCGATVEPGYRWSDRIVSIPTLRHISGTMDDTRPEFNEVAATFGNATSVDITIGGYRLNGVRATAVEYSPGPAAVVFVATSCHTARAAAPL